MRGVCDGEGRVEKVKSGLVDADVDEREVGAVWLGESSMEIGLLEGRPTSEVGMTRGERRGRLCAWMDSSLIFLSESITKLY